MCAFEVVWRKEQDDDEYYMWILYSYCGFFNGYFLCKVYRKRSRGKKLALKQNIIGLMCILIAKKWGKRILIKKYVEI